MIVYHNFQAIAGGKYTEPTTRPLTHVIMTPAEAAQVVTDRPDPEGARVTLVPVKPDKDNKDWRWLLVHDEQATPSGQIGIERGRPKDGKPGDVKYIAQIWNVENFPRTRRTVLPYSAAPRGLLVSPYKAQLVTEGLKDPRLPEDTGPTKRLSAAAPPPPPPKPMTEALAGAHVHPGDEIDLNEPEEERAERIAVERIEAQLSAPVTSVPTQPLEAIDLPDAPPPPSVVLPTQEDITRAQIATTWESIIQQATELVTDGHEISEKDLRAVCSLVELVVGARAEGELVLKDGRLRVRALI